MPFTLVFEGSIKKLPNPFTTETPFGVPYSAGIGDAFERIDQLEEALAEAGVDIPDWAGLRSHFENEAEKSHRNTQATSDG